MRKIIFIFMVTSLFYPIQAQKSVKHLLKTELDSVSYALGISIGAEYTKSLNELPEKINKDLVIAGFTCGMKEDTVNYQINEEEIHNVLNNYFIKIANKEAEKVKLENDKILLENRKKKGVKVTNSGLQYKIITEGKGNIPTEEDIVKVHYVGRLADGTLFDSSKENGIPVEFPVNGAIPGFSEALKMMQVGSKWEIVIPSELGYGADGAGSIIPANSVLFLEIELLEIVSPKEENRQYEEDIDEVDFY